MNAEASTPSNGTPVLEVLDLVASIAGKRILKGVNLRLMKGEVHAIMGRNGSGKSTLSNILMGHSSYVIESGQVRVNGEDIASLTTTERARRGMFLAFQYPMAIPGVTVANFLRAAMRSARGKEISPLEFRRMLLARFKELGIPDVFATRYVNDGFSGGEKKRLEILQMLLLEPSLAILDETDSGLDIDALKTVSEGINTAIARGATALVITHYQRMLDYVHPDVVHVFLDGRIAKTGGPDLALELEQKGYDWVQDEAAAATPGHV